MKFAWIALPIITGWAFASHADTVCHVNAGIAALALAVILGRRRGWPNHPMRAHSLPLTLLGTGILWFGWFGFNAGSALAAGQGAGMAMTVTHLAAASASLVWVAIEWVRFGKPSVVGIVTGTIAGLATDPENIDGPLASARFYGPADVAIDSAGNLFVADAYNCTVRRIALARGSPPVITRTGGLSSAMSSTRRCLRPSRACRAASTSAPSGQSAARTGTGVIWSQAWDELRAFVEQTGIPFYTTPQARGVLPDDHAQTFPAMRSSAFREADLIVVVGTRMNFIINHAAPPRFSANATIARIDIDADEIATAARKVDIGLVGDCRAVLV